MATTQDLQTRKNCRVIDRPTTVKAEMQHARPVVIDLEPLGTKLSKMNAGWFTTKLKVVPHFSYPMLRPVVIDLEPLGTKLSKMNAG